MNSGSSSAGRAPGLSRELAALGSLSERLREQNVVGELCLFGGTVMVLAYNARISTKDVDAVFQTTAAIRKETLRIVAAYNPANQIPAKTQFLVESLFQEGKA